MKRIFFILLVSVLVVIVSIFTVSTLASDKTVVKVWGPGGQGAWMQSSDLAAQFEEAYPQYSVEIEQLPFDTLHDKIIAGFTGGDLPDVFMLGDQTVAEFAVLGGLEPMEDFKKENNYKDEDFMSDAWSHFITLDGTLYAAPAYSEYRVLFYRTDLFEEAGISNPPTTYEELLDYGIKLTNGIDRFGFADQSGKLDLHFFSCILYAKGGNFYTDDHLTCNLTAPAGIEALEFYKSLYDQNIIPKDPAKRTDPYQGFIQGYSAMAESGPWWLGLLAKQPEMDGKWATAPLPADKTTITYGHPNAWMIPAQAKNKDGAKAWLEFFMRVGPQVEFFKGNGNLPVLLAAYDDPALKNHPAMPAFLEAAKRGVDAMYNIPNGDPIQAVIYGMLSELKDGKTTPEKGATDVCQRVNDLLK